MSWFGELRRRVWALLARPDVSCGPLSAYGTALHGLAVAGLAGGDHFAVRCSRWPNGSACYGSSSRPCPPPRAREAALHTNAAAYSDAVSEYAALGRDELREAARAVLAITSGRG